MSDPKRKPGDPYEVGYARPPKQTQFKKGISGNPYGRPRKKPDLYTELTRVLNESVTVTIEGEPQRVTVQQALLLRLRDEALRGGIGVGKLYQKVVETFPEGGTEFDHIEREVGLFRAKALLGLMAEETEHEESDQNCEPMEGNNDG